AIALFGKNVETLQGTLQHQRFGLPFVAAAGSRSWVVRCLAELGRFAEAMTRAEEAVRIAEALDDFLGLSDGYLSIGYLCLRKGEFQRAQAVLECSLALVQASNLWLVFPQHAAALGAVYAFSGQVENALPLLERAMKQSESSKSRATQSHYVAALSEGYLLAGHADEARVLADRALELSDPGRRGDGAWLRRLLGAIAARLDPPQAQHAERWYREALVLAEELGMRPLQAHCHLALGKLYARTDRQEQARL